MSDEQSGIQVGELNGVAMVRIQGKGTHQNSHLLKKFALQVMETQGAQLQRFQIDLSGCLYMDSTFLGMLAGLGLKSKSAGIPPIQMLNPTDRVKSLMEGLGIDSLFEIIENPTSSVSSLQQIQSHDQEKNLKSRDMLEAHQTLVHVAPENEVKFKDVIALLREKVEKDGK